MWVVDLVVLLGILVVEFEVGDLNVVGVVFVVCCFVLYDEFVECVGVVCVGFEFDDIILVECYLEFFGVFVVCGLCGRYWGYYEYFKEGEGMLFGGFYKIVN